MFDDASEETVDSLVAACVEARRTDRQTDCDSIVERHPEFAAEIAVFLDDYDQVERKLAPLRELLSSAARVARAKPQPSPTAAAAIAGANGRQFVRRLRTSLRNLARGHGSGLQGAAAESESHRGR